MTCPRCGGLVEDFEDELSGLVSAKCWNCGRSPLAPPTKTALVRDGVVQPRYPSKETEGRRGRGVEYTPAGAGSAKVRSFSGP